MSDLALNVQIFQEESLVLLRLQGAIDGKTVCEFSNRLDELEKQGFKCFILDMENMKYVNSTGLGTVINIADKLESKGGMILLVKIPPKVQALFEMLGLNTLLKNFPTENEARQYVKSHKKPDVLDLPAQNSESPKLPGQKAPTSEQEENPTTEKNQPGKTTGDVKFYANSSLKYKESNASFMMLGTFLGGILLTVIAETLKSPEGILAIMALAFAIISVVVFLFVVIMVIHSNIYFTALTVDLSLLSETQDIPPVLLANFHKALFSKVWAEKMVNLGVFCTFVFITLKIASLNVAYTGIVAAFLCFALFLSLRFKFITKRILRLLDVSPVVSSKKLANKKASVDMKKVREICQDMAHAEWNIPGLDIAYLYKSCEALGGDYYEVISLDEDRTALVIADIMGKGEEAAVHLPLLKEAIREAAKPEIPPAQVLSKINHAIYSELNCSIFVSMFYGVLDRQTKRMHCANAGHFPAIFYNPGQTDSARIYQPSGTVLGKISDAGFEEIVTDILPGDMIVQYTDGITEARNRKKQQLELTKFMEMIRESRVADASEMVSLIQKGVLSFTKGARQEDDMTLLAVKPLSQFFTSALSLKSTGKITKSGIRATVVHLKGPIDKTTHRKLDSYLAGLLNQGIKAVILHFSQVSNVDDVGVRTLTDVLVKYESKKASLRLVQVFDKYVRSADVVRPLTIFPFYSSIEEALSSLDSGGFEDRDVFTASEDTENPVNFGDLHED